MQINHRNLLCLLVLVLGWQTASAQRPLAVPNSAPVDIHTQTKLQLQVEHGLRPPSTPIANGTFITNTDFVPNQVGKTSNIQAFRLTTSSNPYTILGTRANQLFASNKYQMVGWIYRQDFDLWGGSPDFVGKGLYRLAYSLDNGNTWGGNPVNRAPVGSPDRRWIDVGPLNPLPYPSNLQVGGRYPQVSFFEPNGIPATFSNATERTRYFDSLRFAFTGPTTDASNWGNYVYGLSYRIHNFCRTSGCGQLSNQKNFTKFSFVSQTGQDRNVLIPAGLSQGRKGEFWMVDVSFIGSGGQNNSGRFRDSLYIWKGTATADDSIVWNRYLALRPDLMIQNPTNANLSEPRLTGSYDIAFSPNGQYGWVCFMGTLDYNRTAGSCEYEPRPLMWHSDDFGDTWQGPIEVRLRDYPQLTDFLFTQFTGGEVSSGIPYPAEMDMVVDANGNPHMFTYIMNWVDTCDINNINFISPSAYKGMWNITTTDRGRTWCPVLVDSISVHRGRDINGLTDLSFGHEPQASRSEDGNFIFFSWVDDTISIQNVQNQEVMFPDLFGRGLRISDFYLTDVRQWSNSRNIFYPRTPPTILEPSPGTFKIPTMYMSEPPTQRADAPCAFSFINNLTYVTADFKQPAIDMAVTGITAPATTVCGSSSESITIGVRNTGTQSIPSYTIRYRVTGPNTDLTFDQTISTPLAAGASASHTFSQAANIPNNGSYLIVASVIADGDFACQNNSVERIVRNVGGATNQIFVQDTLRGFCGSALLDAGLQGFTYNWSVIGGTQTGTDQQFELTTIAPAGIRVAVEVSGITACTPNFLRDTVVVVINDKPANDLQAQANTEVCGGSNLVLTANSSAGADLTYAWGFGTRLSEISPVAGQTGPTYSLSNVNRTRTGFYRATVTNSVTGCVNEQTIFVKVWDNNVDLKQSLRDVVPGIVIQNNAASLCDIYRISAENANNQGSDYRWYIDGIEDPAYRGRSFYTILDTGVSKLIKVEVLDPAGCGTVVADSITITVYDSVRAVINRVPTTDIRQCCDSIQFINASVAGRTPITRFYWEPSRANFIAYPSSNLQTLLPLLGSPSASGISPLGLAWNTTGNIEMRLVVQSGACRSVDTVFFNVTARGAGANCALSPVGSDCSVVGMESDITAGMLLETYPNPTTDRLNLRMLALQATDVKIELLTLSGQVLMTDKPTVLVEFETSYDLSNLASGIYMLRVSTEHGMTTRKIVKQ